MQGYIEFYIIKEKAYDILEHFGMITEALRQIDEFNNIFIYRLVD